MTEPMNTDVARYYYVARTVHIERQSEYRPGWLFYSRTRADFDEELASRTPGVRRASAWAVGLFVIRRGVRVLEMPEPLAVPVWPHAMIVHSLVLLHNLLCPRSARIRIVTYAIENLSPAAKFRGRVPVPGWVARGIVSLFGGFLLRTTDRVVFGTQAALDTYIEALPSAMRRRGLETELVWALPMRGKGVTADMRPPIVVFLGTFEERKGIHHLLRAWPRVASAMPEARLVLMGKAGDIDVVRAYAGSRPADVTLLEDPPRARIFEVLRESKCLVLFSQPTPVWKEQVGLPILEALSQGCEIVSSDETGIADWLAGAGHQVVPQAADEGELTAAILASLHSSRTPADIVAELPQEDTRKAADDAMFVA